MTAIITKNSNFVRLDSIISEVLGISRAKSASLIKSNKVYLNGNLAPKPSIQVAQGDKIEIDEDANLKQDLPHLETESLDELIATKPQLQQIDILHKDSDILIINKPPNLVLHPAPNLKEPTLQDWLKCKAKDFGITLNEDSRYGIVHRLDRETSGVLSIAKNATAFNTLSNQLKSRQMGRIYLAIIEPPLKEAQTLECYLGRNPKNRLKITQIGKATRHIIPQECFEYGNGEPTQKKIKQDLQGDLAYNPSTDSRHLRYAKSAFLPLLHSRSNAMQLIAVKLFTGRTHQIRAQLEGLGRHIIGDSLYGFKLHSKAGKEFSTFLAQSPLARNLTHRIFLHAYVLYLCHPNDERGKISLFRAQILADMVEFLQTFFDLDGVNEALDIERILRDFRAF